MLIQAWHRAQGNTRTKMLIPDTAHGTNPASAACRGFSSVKVPLGPDILTVEDVAALMDDDCAGILDHEPEHAWLFTGQHQEIAELVHAAAASRRRCEPERDHGLCPHGPYRDRRHAHEPA